MPLGIDKCACSSKFVLGNNDRGSLIFCGLTTNFYPLMQRGFLQNTALARFCVQWETNETCMHTCQHWMPTQCKTATSDGRAPTSQFPIAPCALGQCHQASRQTWLPIYNNFKTRRHNCHHRNQMERAPAHLQCALLQLDPFPNFACPGNL